MVSNLGWRVKRTVTLVQEWIGHALDDFAYHYGGTVIGCYGSIEARLRGTRNATEMGTGRISLQSDSCMRRRALPACKAGQLSGLAVSVGVVSMASRVQCIALSSESDMLKYSPVRAGDTNTSNASLILRAEGIRAVLAEAPRTKSSQIGKVP